jgi:hypothetical protein
VFFIFSEITNNNYHYNLLIAVKNDFYLDLILKKKFNLIEIISINQILEKDINCDYIRTLFDFNKLYGYSFYHYNEPDYDDFIKNVQLTLKNTKEYLDYENFDNKYPVLSKLDENLFKKHLYLLNNMCGVRSEILDQRIYYSYVFKSFGWCMYALNYEFSDNEYYFSSELTHHFKINHTYNCNSTFFLKEIGRIFYDEDLFDYYKKGYSPGCLLDVIFVLNFGTQGDDFRCNIFISEISVPRIKYGTAYKQRLKNLKILN